MSTQPSTISPPVGNAPPPPERSFVRHAKLIGLLTFGSRILGMLRESIAARYFGAGLVQAAFTVAFTIPNLFRRLFGEGALSAAFIPLYSQALKEQDREQANRFAAASVNLLISILIGLTLLGEAILLAIWLLWEMRPDRLLAIRLTAIMLPYVLLVCGTAFLGAVLQVHRRFGLVAAAPIVLNVALIGSTVLGARIWDLNTEEGRVSAIVVVSISVLVAGVVQVLMLLPALRGIGFRFQLVNFWTEPVKRMLKLSLPVAMGAGVLQISILIDRAMSFLLASSVDENGRMIEYFRLFGQTIHYPMEYGAAARLAWAQYLYQFPLGIFAIALATAIFPTLSADALDRDRGKFKEGLRQGLRLALLEGLPASVGLVLVAQPAVQVLFERGRFTPHDTQLVAGSLRFFASAIWAFSLAQILNRAFYSLRDTWTPLAMSLLTLAADLGVKLCLIWSMGEQGMAVGTAVSFTMQVIVMVVLLQRRIGSLELGKVAAFALKIVIATAAMAGACLLVQLAPFFPQGHERSTALARLSILLATGGVVYVGACSALGLPLLGHLIPKRFRK
jgi:putative peptidoglycan lipid II flippase